MSLVRRVASFGRRDSARLAAIEHRLDALFELCAAQNHLVTEMYRMMTVGNVENLNDTLDAVAVAQTEAMVYLNRSMRDLRDEVAPPSA